MAELMFPDIGASFREGQAFGTQQRQLREGEERRSSLSRLASQAYTTPAADQRSLLSQMAAYSPEAAANQEKQFNADEDRRMQRLGAAARYLDSARRSGDTAQIQGAWTATRPMLKELIPDAQYPDQWDDASMAPLLYQALAATGGGGGGNVLSTYVNADGIRMAIMRDGSQRPLGEAENRLQLRDAPGMPLGAFDPRQGTIAPVREAGAPGAGAPPPQQAGAPQFTIDPSLPPEVQASIRANEPAWAAAPNGSTAQLPPRASTGVAAPRPEIDAGEQVRLQLALDAGRRAEEAAKIAAYTRQLGNAPAGFRFKQDGTLEPIPGGPKPAGAAATEDERKAAGWLSQASNAYANMEKALQEDSSANEPGFLETYIPIDEIANRTRSDERQRYVQASSSFGEAVLRAATGAGVNRDEAVQKIRELTPQRGDSQGVRDQKRAAMRVYIDSLRTRAGRAAPQADAASGPSQAQSRAAARPQTEADFAALPSGATYIDPDDGKTYRKP